MSEVRQTCMFENVTDPDRLHVRKYIVRSKWQNILCQRHPLTLSSKVKTEVYSYKWNSSSLGIPKPSVLWFWWLCHSVVYSLPCDILALQEAMCFNIYWFFCCIIIVKWLGIFHVTSVPKLNNCFVVKNSTLWSLQVSWKSYCEYRAQSTSDIF